MLTPTLWTFNQLEQQRKLEYEKRQKMQTKALMLATCKCNCYSFIHHNNCHWLNATINWDYIIIIIIFLLLYIYFFTNNTEPKNKYRQENEVMKVFVKLNLDTSACFSRWLWYISIYAAKILIFVSSEWGLCLCVYLVFVTFSSINTYFLGPLELLGTKAWSCFTVECNFGDNGQVWS